MSINNEDRDSLTGLLKTFERHIYKHIDKSLPCKVIEVSEDRQRVTVQPLIKILDIDGNDYERAQIVGLPVYFAGAGNFLISFNIKVGDFGWVDASDRDISLFLQSYENSIPNTNRTHSFSDARFIPDIMTNYEIASEDADSMTIQNRDGTVKISLNDSRIKITSPKVEVVTENFNVTASSIANINGFKIKPDGSAESPVSVTAPLINGTTNVKFGGKSGVGHQHTNGNNGNPTGAPI